MTAFFMTSLVHWLGTKWQHCRRILAAVRRLFLASIFFTKGDQKSSVKTTTTTTNNNNIKQTTPNGRVSSFVCFRFCCYRYGTGTRLE